MNAVKVGMVVGALAALALCAAPRTVGAQSLADLAKQEAARRKSIQAPVKVYTNDNLVQIPGETIPTPPGPAPAVPKPTADAGSKSGDGVPAVAAAQTPAEPAKTEAYWRKRITDVRDLRNRNAMYAEAMQTRINSLWADFTARDDPAQRAVIGEEHKRALAELDRLKNEQADLDKQIAAIEEEARRAGVPPGWLRLP